MSKDAHVNVSIIIKALNEESHIEAAIRSALRAVDVVGGEVILADSLSSDLTVEIAQRFPVTITQLENPAERRCGAGPQLGYQIARGDYVYILDGDMELEPDFLPAALQAMREDDKLAGVAGLVEERSEASYQFRGRKRRRREKQPGEVAWLDMGGLYRAEAIRESGYFSDRNLHCYEEMELGLRLGKRGWKLRRLAIPAVLHHGYDEGNWELLRRRWRSRYLDGTGEVLRAARGQPYLMQVLFALKHFFVGLGLWVALLIGFLLLPVSSWLLVAVLIVLTGLIVIRMLRIGSVSDACFGQLVWQVTALAMVRGYFANWIDPNKPLDAVIIKFTDI
jgi:GT2 family glycosyltransferase